MDINKYIQDYDFNDYIKDFRMKFKEQKITEKYLKSYPEENFIKFSKDFWENPNVSIDELKEKYNISKQITYSDIIKSFPTDDYIKFLNMYYGNSDIEDLVREFTIPHSRIEKIIIPIIICNEKTYCPMCFNNLFEIEIQNKNNSNTIYRFKCKNCKIRINYSDLLASEQMEQEIQRITKENAEFNDSMNLYEKALEDIKCPKCQEKLYLNRFSESYSYQIKCRKCRYSSNNIEKTIGEFQAWKQRAAMMIAIKAKEQELIEKALESKKEQDIIFNKEDIIQTEENKETLNFLQDTLDMDNIQIWGEIFKRIRSCNRLEKKVLSEVIELTKKEGEEKILPFGKNEIKLYAYMPKDPVVYNLINKTKIIVMRQILRKLIRNSFIIVSEEANYILIPELLVNNLEAIKNLMIAKDTNPQIRYLVFQRQNFTCMTCGETGRPLKIAYLTSDKNINDLDNLIALCDNCHEVATRNEILIDGTITFEVDYLDKNRLKSHEFLIQYCPELKMDENVTKTLEVWESDYKLSDIIKALTITIDKMKKNKIEGTVNTLFSYTNAILKKTIEAGNSVKIYDSLKEQYGLNKWIEDILE